MILITKPNIYQTLSTTYQEEKGIISFYVLNFYTNFNVNQVKHSSYCKKYTFLQFI